MMVSKGIIYMAQTAILNEDIREWRRQATNQKTWPKFKIFFHEAHHKQRKSVTTIGKEGYIAAVKNIYGVLHHPPEEHHKAI